MDLVDVNLNLLVPLQALLRERSITGAARRLGLSQPATSHALARCRRLFGDELLHRVGRGYELTPRALSLQAPLDDILTKVRGTVLDPAVFDPATTCRTFTVAGANSTLTVVGPRLMELLSHRAPHARLRLLSNYTGSPDELLRSVDVDVVLVPDVLPTAHTRRHLYTDRWVLVADARRTDVPDRFTLDAIGDLPCAVFEDGPARVLPERTLEANGVRRQVRVQYSDFLLAPMLLLDTRMVGILQERLARRLAAHLPLRIEPLPIATTNLCIDEVWNPRADQDAAARWLRRTLREATAPLRRPE
ncbi:LysR family transcriptional regulator [Streptomyces spongiae]|uniref:LysR family transcriptional regulator n=1 Tax=Streptomyces spongiae TaxID=565072 RepID=A0A5N8X9Q5_9ACTN|nr:LysR family transcriptional regulator [Streptomyces spongiae]MPY56172.1 LysR family transcriptional regulator [Streptomyces spongiae]